MEYYYYLIVQSKAIVVKLNIDIIPKLNTYQTYLKKKLAL